MTIATAAHTVAPALPKWGYVLIAAAATALLTIRPLGAIRVLRRYATGAVLIVMGYLLVQLLRHPLPSLTHGTWSGYWAATDTVVAVAISFALGGADRGLLRPAAAPVGPVGFTPASWMSASILSFCAAAIVTLLVRAVAQLRQR